MSALLDVASVSHLMAGNIVEVTDRKFFVEEACSGIGAVFLLLASAAVYAAWKELRIVVGLPLLIAVVTADDGGDRHCILFKSVANLGSIEGRCTEGFCVGTIAIVMANAQGRSVSANLSTWKVALIQ
jgi:hypothetical protein